MNQQPARRQSFMKSFARFGALAMAALFAASCDDVTNPVEEFGQLVDPYVRFEFPDDIAIPGVVVPVVFVMTTRVEENVDVSFTFGGDAAYGTDYWAVDRSGTRRSDVTANGGTARITYRADQSTFPRDTLRLFLPAAARAGRTVELEITGATTTSGRRLETGFIDEYRTYVLSIEAPQLLPGTYVGQRTGDLGTVPASVTISKPATPVTIAGTAYDFILSDYTGDAEPFGAPIPWAFNVTQEGVVRASPRSSQFASVTSTVTGTFDFVTQQLRLNVTLTCCGGEGLTWQLVVARR
jgi:hypothetical protein